jgi:diguanylate cyclase (GGDEF)-like protein/PAS domain S-box-containing protein
VSVKRTELMRAALVAVIYFLVSAVTVRLTRFDGGVSFIWVSNALLLAELMHLPTRRWPIVLCFCGMGVFISTAFFGMGLYAAPFMTPFNLAEAAIGAALLRKLNVPSDEIESLRRVGLFVLVSGAIVPAGLAFGPAAVTAVITGTGYWHNWVHWTVGHGLGTVIFTPIVSLVVGGELRKWLRAAGPVLRWEAAGLLFLMLTVSCGVFAQVQLPLLFLPMLPMMLAAFRLGFTGAAASTAILSIVSVLFTVRGYGPIQLIHGQVGLQVNFLQFYLATMVVTALPVAATLQGRKTLFLLLHESEARYRIIAERSSDLILNIDVTGEMRFVSPSVAELFGHDPTALLGRMAGEFVTKSDVGIALRGHAAAIAEPMKTHIAEYRIRTADDRDLWAEAHMRAVVGVDGIVAGVVNSLRDISQRKKLEGELDSAAHTDVLTGIANRRAFSEAVSSHIADFGDGQRIAFCALFDIDHFKAVNDSYGHEAGDRALKAFAGMAKETVRQSDLVARVGGEEFAIILHGTDVEGAMRVCDRLRERVAAMSVPLESGQAIRFTVSAGVAPIGLGMDETAILRAADAALYRAKSAGRNRLMLAT